MLTEVHIYNLRNLHNTEIHFSSGSNIIFGPNGSGKTSLLEAIYLLSCGRSFRTHQANRAIQYNAEQVALFGKIQRANEAISVGTSRHKKGECQFKLDGNKLLSIAEIAKLLPVQVVHPESHRLLTDGPKLRRQFLDWGVFHVEPHFYPSWQRFQRSLKQRNAALKKRMKKQEISVWNKELLETSTLLHTYRHQYFQQLEPLFSEIFTTLLGENRIRITYYPGWKNEEDLETALHETLERDLELGYTQMGPHRADLQMKVDQVPAQDALSQGQQKLVVYALKLAQGKLYHATTGNNPIYLIDDLPAELDKEKRQLVAKILEELHSQVFITGAEHSEMEDIIQPDTKLFHVEHGKITPKN